MTKLINDRELAARLSTSVSSIWRWVKTGAIPQPLRIGGMSRWTEADVDNILAKAERERETSGPRPRPNLDVHRARGRSESL